MLFGRKKTILEDRIRQIENEKQVLLNENMEMKEQLGFSYEMKTIMNAFNGIGKLNFDMFPNRLRNDNVVKIDIQSMMKSGDVDECFLGMWYGVKLVGFDVNGKEREYLSVPVYESGDGSMYSFIANWRRRNMYEFTVHLADFIEKELLRGLNRSGSSIEICRTEEKYDQLLYYKEDPERNEEF